MSLTLEVSAEIEAELREVAQEQGRDLDSYASALFEEQARREIEQRRARLAALQELADLSQELDLDRLS